MNITVLQENLWKAIQDSSRFIASKPQLPILSGIYLIAKEGNLTIKSTDLRVGFQTTVGGKIEAEGECIVPAKTLLDLLGSLHAGSLHLELSENSLHLTQGRVRAKIPTFPVTDYPPFPELESEFFTVSSDHLFSAIEKTTYAASLDETRPVLASALLHFEDNTLTCVCTDGYRLVVTTTPSETAKTPLKILLNAKMLTEVVRAISRSKPQTVDFAVSKELQQVCLKTDDTIILARLTEGDFPPYNQIIPQSFLVRTLLDREECMQALKTTMVFARESSSIVTMEISSKTCKISAISATTGENEVSLDTTYEGTEVKKISFNAKFLLDALSHIESDRVELCMNQELKPAVFFPEGSEDNLTVIMPFKR